jgi:hypothetical protein
MVKGMTERQTSSPLRRLWMAIAGDVGAIRSTKPWERSRWEQARFDSFEWPRRSGWGFTILAGLVPAASGALAAAVLGRADVALGLQVAGAAAGVVAGFGLLWLVCMVSFLTRASGRQAHAARLGIAAAEARLAEFNEESPQLSFGRAHIPRHSERLPLDPDAIPSHSPFGRIIRVPISNAHGVGTAEAVQALLTFLPDDPEGSFSPRHPVLAEWDSDALPTQVDLPGNGQPQLINVAVVTHGPWPFVYEWTRHSRAAELNGYGISSGPAEIRIEVRGSGPGRSAPAIVDTLRIDVRDGILRADWASAGPDEATNWVPHKKQVWGIGIGRPGS